MLVALKQNNFIYVAYYLLPFELDIHFGPVGCGQEVLNHIVQTYFTEGVCE